MSQSVSVARVAGFVDTNGADFGYLRRGVLAGSQDLHIPAKLMHRYDLRSGDRVIGVARPKQASERYAGLIEAESVNGIAVKDILARPRFAELTPVHPYELFNLETDSKNLSQRLINLVNPIGRGQRALIVSPPKAGKTMLLKHIANGISTNYPEVLLMVALIGERPEEVTDMRRSIKGEVIASTFDEPTEHHTRVAEMALEIAKRQVEAGRDVVILIDSITRLARAYNLALDERYRVVSTRPRYILPSVSLAPRARLKKAAR